MPAALGTCPSLAAGPTGLGLQRPLSWSSDSAGQGVVGVIQGPISRPEEGRGRDSSEWLWCGGQLGQLGQHGMGLCPPGGRVEASAFRPGGTLPSPGLSPQAPPTAPGSLALETAASPAGRLLGFTRPLQAQASVCPLPWPRGCPGCS